MFPLLKLTTSLLEKAINFYGAYCNLEDFANDGERRANILKHLKYFKVCLFMGHNNCFYGMMFTFESNN